MANNPISGFPDTWGKHGVAIVEHSGPKSYTTGGESLSTPSWGGSNVVGLRGYAFVASGVDYSGTYCVDPIYAPANTPNAGIRTLIKLIWRNATTDLEPAAATDLSGYTVRLLVVGG